MMSALNPSEKRTRSWALLHVALWLTLAMAVVATSSVPAAAAASPTAVRADTRSIAKQLAAAGASEPVGSCRADDTAPSPFVMFGSGRAVGSGGGPQAAPTPSPFTVMCALPLEHREESEDCSGEHIIKYQILGAGPNAKVTAELMGLDAKGNLLRSFLVKNGDEAHLASRRSRREWRFRVERESKSGMEYTVRAPVPLLHVTVEDQGQKAEAFCSNIPWVDMIQPNGGVVSSSSDAATNVLAAVPLTNPAALHVLVDGDDLLVQVPNYLGCSNVSPCGGTATLNGQALNYTNLVVDIASSIGSLSSNTVRVTLNGLSCGGHVIKVTSSRLPGKRDHDDERRTGRWSRDYGHDDEDKKCYVDDLSDTGTSSVFAITITDPVPGQITPLVPTPVAGEVCSGTQIVDVNINGKTLSVAGETHVIGNGTTGDVYKVKIDTTLDRTDLVRDVLKTHDAPLGTFDAGTNRLAVSAKEILGNRTYKSVMFATGAVAPIGVDVNAKLFQSSALQATVNDQLRTTLQANVQQAMAATATELENAYVVGISKEGTQTLFNKLCTTPIPFEGQQLTPGQIFQKAVTRTIEALHLPSFHVSGVPCAPDPDLTVSITNVTVGDTVACTVDFQDGLFAVTMGLPNIRVDAHASGHAQDDIPVFGGCLDGVTISTDAHADLTNIHLDFNVTEDNLLHNTFSSSNFDAGTTAAVQGAVDVSFCGVGVLCEIAADALKFLSGGAIDLLHIDFSFAHALDFQEAVGANKPDPVKLKEIKVDEQVVANFDQKVSGAVTEVHITPAGISAGLKGTFATTLVDLGVEGTPGITLTPAPVPRFQALRDQGAKDAFIGLSDDAINMMFASLTAAGKLKAGDAQGCFDTGATVGSLLPADCDTLTVDTPPGLATSAARGYCHAVKGDNCDSLNFNSDGFLTGTEQGICHGALGHTCSTISPQGDLVKIGACLVTPNFNLHATQPLLFCAKGDVPPRMLFPNTGVPGGSVPAALRLNDLTVALVIDRTGNHAVDGALKDAPGCFTPGASTAVDCSVLSACLDLNLNFSMQFLNSCPGGKPGFKSSFNSIQILSRDIGVVCSGATSPTSDGHVLSAASDDTITIPIATNAGQLSPDICGAGLDLGGLVSCATPQILSIEAGGSPDLRDYLGITCKIQ
jgi:hypothetical protein